MLHSLFIFPKVITVIKFDKEGNKIQEKKIEEKPLTFPKAPGMQFDMSSLMFPKFRVYSKRLEQIEHIGGNMFKPSLQN